MSYFVYWTRTINHYYIPCLILFFCSLYNVFHNELYFNENLLKINSYRIRND